MNLSIPPDDNVTIETLRTEATAAKEALVLERKAGGQTLIIITALGVAAAIWGGCQQSNQAKFAHDGQSAELTLSLGGRWKEYSGGDRREVLDAIST